MAANLLPILLLAQGGVAFAPSNGIRGRILLDGNNNVRAPSHLAQSPPIRKSGSLFGITEYNRTSSNSVMADNSTVTILNKKKSSDATTIAWEEDHGDGMDQQSSVEEENNVEEIANSLLLDPPRLDVKMLHDATADSSDDGLGEVLMSKRESLKRAWNKSEDTVIDDTASGVSVDDDTDNEETAQYVDAGELFEQPSINELSNNHDVISITEEQQKVTSIPADIAPEEISLVDNAIDEVDKEEENDIVDMNAKGLQESSSREITTNHSDISPTDDKDDGNDVETRLPSPTHSIEEDYEQIRMAKRQAEDAAAELTASSAEVDADDEVVYGFDSSTAVTVELGQDELQDNSPVVDDTECREQPKSFRVASSASSLETEKLDDVVEPTNSDLPSPLNAILSTATSLLSPKPPLSPPTASTIMNSDAATSNLVEINTQLQQTSQSQREDLGRLRRKINELERQLIRAKRERITQMEDEVNARVDIIKKDCEQQVTDATDSMIRLEKELDKLKVDLNDSIHRLKQTEEAKERVAAEYGFVAKAYTEVKRALDTQQKEWDEKIRTLENQLDHYQKEARQWKEECANKANMMESSTARIVQMQNTIEGLQSVIKTKEDEIQRIISAKAKEVEQELSQAKRELRDEYEELLSKKSKKIGEVRRALRSANEKRRRMEHVARRDTAEALNEMHTKMMVEIDALNAVLAEKETELMKLRVEAAEAERVVEDRERLLAEMMFLTKSVETMQANLTSTNQKYDELKHLYDKETTSLRQANEDKADEIEGLVQVSNANIAKICFMEAQIDELETDLEKERALNADLVRAQANANILNEQLDSLKKESQTLTLTYEKQVKQLSSRIEQLENDKASLQQTMADQREGSLTALDDKITSIAVLEQELAETLNVIQNLNSTLSDVNVQLDHQTKQHALQLQRADDLEREIELFKQNTVVGQVEASETIGSALKSYECKVQALTQQNLLSQQLINAKLGELSQLKMKIDEMSNVARSSDSIPSDEIIHKLKTDIEMLSASSRQSKAEANEKLLLQKKVLDEQQGTIISLKNQLDTAEKAAIDAKALPAKPDPDSELASLKAKEKIRLKNQVIKEKDDVIAHLNTQLNDIQFEKEKIQHALDDEKKGNADFYHNHEMQIKATEDKLNRKHAAEVRELENEMNESVYELEMEIKVLQKKLAESEVILSQSSVTGVQEPAVTSSRIKELQSALQQSKDKEVELINRNMMMKNQIENLEAQKKLLVMSASDAEKRQRNENIHMREEIELPSYYNKESRRARLKRALTGLWGRIRKR